MKKLSAILITLILVISLSACGKNNNSGGNGNMQSDDNNSFGLNDSISSIADDVMDKGSSDSNASNVKLTADEALSIALEKAGVKKENISNLENHLEHDDGTWVYDIDFDTSDTEYSYDIHADTGDIISSDRDRRD